MRKAHQIINIFMQGETSETWVKPREKKQHGKVNFKSLQFHYGGEGNIDAQIKESEVMRNILHYKNENAMSFAKLLTNMQTMFTGFEEKYYLLI